MDISNNANFYIADNPLAVNVDDVDFSDFSNCVMIDRSDTKRLANLPPNMDISISDSSWTNSYSGGDQQIRLTIVVFIKIVILILV